MDIEKCVEYCVDLHRKNTDALGFIPKPRLLAYASNGQVLIETENGDACGFMVFGNGCPTLRIYQACIQYDARRRKHGLNLVKQLREIALARNAEGIALRCAEGLAANAFWREAGFTHVRTTDGGRRRNRKIYTWYLPMWPCLIPPQTELNALA